MTFFLQTLANFTKNNIFTIPYVACMPQKNTLQENGSSAAILRYLLMTKFPWKLKYMAKYILKAFFLTTFPSTQKKCPKIYVVTLVLPLNDKKKSTYLSKDRFFLTHSDSCCILSTSVSKRSVLSISLCCFAENSKVK